MTSRLNYEPENLNQKNAIKVDEHPGRWPITGAGLDELQELVKFPWKMVKATADYILELEKERDHANYMWDLVGKNAVAQCESWHKANVDLHNERKRVNELEVIIRELHRQREDEHRLRLQAEARVKELETERDEAWRHATINGQLVQEINADLIKKRMSDLKDHPGRWPARYEKTVPPWLPGEESIVATSDYILELENKIVDQEKHIAILQAKLSEFMK